MKFNSKRISGFLIFTTTIILAACGGEGSDQNTHDQAENNLEKKTKFTKSIINLLIFLQVSIVILLKLLNIQLRIMKSFLQSHITYR